MNDDHSTIQIFTIKSWYLLGFTGKFWIYLSSDFYSNMANKCLPIDTYDSDMSGIFVLSKYAVECVC